MLQKAISIGVAFFSCYDLSNTNLSFFRKIQFCQRISFKLHR